MVYSLPNLKSSSHVDLPPPWEAKLELPTFSTKRLFRQWCIQTNTAHQFYNLTEPIQPATRSSKSNPPQFLHGVVADFDIVGGVSDAEVDAGLKRFTEHPRALCRSFSGGLHVVWEFERPMILDLRYQDKLLLALSQALNLHNLWPGLDIGAFQNPHQYYCSGRHWQIISEHRISEDFLFALAMDASSTVDWGELDVPMEEVAKKVEEDFPKQWPGKFELGARGPIFWTDLDDGLCCIVREQGIQSFSTHIDPFHPWGSLLGVDFVNQFQAKKYESIISDFYYLGTSFELDTTPQGAFPKWSHLTRAGIVGQLKTRGLSSKAKNGAANEIERAIALIETNNMADFKAPFLHNKEKVIEYQRHRYINTNRCFALEPIKGSREWGESFPWISAWLDQFFKDEAKPYFLSWLHHAYSGASSYAPVKSQAIFLAGPTNTGKTLLSRRIVGPMFGGYADVSNYLTGKTNFTSQCYTSSVWVLDDDPVGSSPRAHEEFSNLVKKLVANPAFEYEAKFEKACQIPWHGQIMVSCNDDAQSLQIIPDMEISIMDKVCLYGVKAGAEKFDFPVEEILLPILKKELPHFCRFILEYKIPEHCLGRARFKIKSYQDQSLMESALINSGSGRFEESLRLWIESWLTGQSTGIEVWEGSTAKLHRDMDRLADRNLGIFGMKLNKLIGTKHLSWLTTFKTHEGYQHYKITQPTNETV